MSRGRVVNGVIGDDIHIVENRIMQLALEECGFSVTTSERAIVLSASPKRHSK